MKNILLVWVILLGIFLSDCEKNNHNPLIGQWQWYKSIQGNRSHSFTAESVDSTYYVEFNKDGFFYSYNNSKDLITKSEYKLDTEDQLNIFYLNSGFSYGYSVDSDTLSIWGLNDLVYYISYFFRID